MTRDYDTQSKRKLRARIAELEARCKADFDATVQYELELARLRAEVERLREALGRIVYKDYKGSWYVKIRETDPINWVGEVLCPAEEGEED